MQTDDAVKDHVYTCHPEKGQIRPPALAAGFGHDSTEPTACPGRCHQLRRPRPSSPLPAAGKGGFRPGRRATKRPQAAAPCLARHCCPVVW